MNIRNAISKEKKQKKLKRSKIKHKLYERHSLFLFQKDLIKFIGDYSKVEYLSDLMMKTKNKLKDKDILKDGGYCRSILRNASLLTWIKNIEAAWYKGIDLGDWYGVVGEFILLHKNDSYIKLGHYIIPKETDNGLIYSIHTTIQQVDIGGLGMQGAITLYKLAGVKADNLEWAYHKDWIFDLEYLTKLVLYDK